MTILPSTAAATIPNRHSLSPAAVTNNHRPNSTTNLPIFGTAMDGSKNPKSNLYRHSSTTAAVNNEPTSASVAASTAAKNLPSSSSSPITIDGWQEDAMLTKSMILTRIEVFRRRRRRLLQLKRIYRDLYWLTAEDLRLKHRKFYWDYGKSPFQEDEDKLNLDQETAENGPAAAASACGGNGLGLGSRLQCSVYGCTTKAMALTKFCPLHILSDPKQKLYKPCSYTVRTAPTGPILCEPPVLRSVVPTLCPSHLKQAEKLLAEALRKAGLNTNSNSKIAPKIHVLVAEFVRQIQSKRRVLRKAVKDIVEVKEESCL